MTKHDLSGTPKPAADNAERKKELETGEDRGVIWSDRKHHLWFPFSFTKYTVRNGRLYVDKGLFNTVSDQTLLYRITDIRLKRDFWQKIFGTGTVILVSKVDVNHEILLENIKRPRETNEMLADLIEETRQKKNVVGKEFYSKGCGLEYSHDHDHDMDDDLEPEYLHDDDDSADEYFEE